MMFENWLLTTRELQIKSFGTDPATLEGEDLVEYVHWNHTAVGDEMYEALHEVNWKPWSVGERGFTNRDAYVNEIVDTMHFLGNLLVAAKCTDEELSLKYAAKQQKNRERMASRSYSAIKPKCPVCSRNYDEGTTECRPGTPMSTPYCAYK